MNGRELEKFNELNLDERSIVFYSEDISSFVHFEQIIHELTERNGISDLLCNIS